FGGRVERADLDVLDPRPAHDDAGPPARVTGVQQVVDDALVGDRLKRTVVPVDRLRPRCDRAAGRDLQDVRREAPVRDAQVVRRGTRVAVEVEVGDLGDPHAGGDGVGDGALDHRLIPDALVVRLVGD